MENKKLLGKRIKEIRKNNSLTQEKLAELVGIETMSLSAIESGRHFPSMPTLEKIASILKVELKTLFDYSHFTSKDDMCEFICANLNSLDDKQLHFVYKFIEQFKN